MGNNGNGNYGYHQNFNSEEHFNKMAKDLDLTEDQKVKIKPIIEKAIAEHKQGDGRMGNKKDMFEQIKPILTAEQVEKSEEMHKLYLKLFIYNYNISLAN